MTESRIQVGLSQDYLNTNKVTTAAGEVHNEIVEQYAVKSTANTSETSLLGGGTFTGDFEQNNIPDVMASCQTDAAGTLYFDFSVDGVNVNTYPVEGFGVAAGIHEFHTAVKGARYFRVRFVNGAADQTYLRLHTYYGTYRQSVTPLNQSIGGDSDALVVRSVTDPDLEFALGKIAGRTVIHKFGRNSAVSTTFVPVSTDGLYRTPQVAAATQLRIKAGNVNDTAAGTGARSVTIEGINADGDEVVETIATAGTSPSANSTNSFVRLYRMYIASSGTYATQTLGSHVGDIVIENAAGTQDWASIDATDFAKGQSEIAAYTVPNGYTAYIREIEVSVDSNKTATIVLFKREGILETAAPYSPMRAVQIYDGVSGVATFEQGSPIGTFPANTDIGFMAKVAATTSSVSIAFEILLVAD